VRSRSLLGVALVLATCLTFEGLRGAGFLLFDDDRYVARNPVVHQGLTPANAAWAFRTLSLSNWHPLTWLSLMLDVELFGVNARAHHLMNLALHAATTLALFLVLDALTRARLPSAAVAALFALHPLHVESVAWISERKDLLAALFFVLALGAHGRYARTGTWGAYALGLWLTALALLSKSMAVTLPFAMLLLDAWPLARPDLRGPLRRALRLLLEKAPHLALSAGASAVATLAQQASGATWTLEQLPLGARLANAAVACARYLGKTIWPADLAILYPVRSWPPAAVAGALVLLAGLTALALRARRRSPALAFGWLFFLGTLVPTLGLVQVGNQSMADRYTYIPLIGLFVALCFGALPWLGRVRGPRGGLGIAMAGALGGLALASHAYVAKWRDTRTLFTHALAHTERNPQAHYTLALALAGEGEPEAALRELERALAIAPGYAKAAEARARLLSQPAGAPSHATPTMERPTLPGDPSQP
jgi:tetratricopeptide (TPR) repeat protein